MRAYGEANWKAGYKQGALADASPDNRVPEAWTNLLAYVLQDDMHNQLTPRVVDIAYTAFMQAKRPNDEDGGASDWFNDTKPKVAEMIAKLRKDLIEELAAQPADTSTAVLQWIVKTASEAKEPCGENPESPAAIRNAKLAAIAGEAAQALGIVRGLSYDIAAPQPVQPAPKQPRWITHVAIKYAGVVYSLVAPKRHCDIHLKLIRQSGGLHGPTFHGFLDNYGNFLSRAEAFIIAKQAGQIKPGMRIDGFLYSEDVW